MKVPSNEHSATALVRVWDLPLRLWHWLFAAAVGGALYTGLSEDIALIDWHMRCGLAALALLVWRLGWGLFGPPYARWRHVARAFWPGSAPSSAARPAESTDASVARTRPGAMMALALPLMVVVQAGAGLFTSDFIFTDGPLVRHVSAATVDLLSAVHHRAYWLVLGLIGLHLSAHAYYGARRDPLVLSMLTGRKRVPLPPARDRLGLALVWLVVVAVASGLVTRYLG